MVKAMAQGGWCYEGEVDRDDQVFWSLFSLPPSFSLLFPDNVLNNTFIFFDLVAWYIVVSKGDG